MILNGVELTEKEFRHIKSRYLKFAREENQCSEKCPMGWEGTSGTGLSCVGERVYNKTRKACEVSCCCQLFYEFKSRGCPCSTYGENAFHLLAKVVRRLKRIKQDNAKKAVKK